MRSHGVVGGAQRRGQSRTDEARRTRYRDYRLWTGLSHVFTVLESARTQPLRSRCLNGGEKASGVGAVDQSVVIGERQIETDRTPIDSFALSSTTTRGRLTMAPVPNIAACGGTRIGVSNNAPGFRCWDRERCRRTTRRVSGSRPGAGGDVGDRPGQPGSDKSPALWMTGRGGPARFDAEPEVFGS